MLCSSGPPRPEPGSSDPGILHRTRKLADHHGTKTGLPPKDAFSKGRHPALSQVELGLSRQNICIRPASWSKNEQNIPNQFPCYGFFGYSREINDPNHAHDDHFHLFLISTAHGSWGGQKSHGEDPQKNHHGCEAIRGHG